MATALCQFHKQAQCHTRRVFSSVFVFRGDAILVSRDECTRKREGLPVCRKLYSLKNITWCNLMFISCVASL